MKYEVPFRIIITDPLPGVAMKVQRGRDELIEPVSSVNAAITFEFAVTADVSGSTPNFLGKFAQGPKDARFIYVNSGRRAGQHTTWDRRAKLSLMSISKDAIEAVVKSPGSRLETAIYGVGRDGGPVCASVKGLEWKVVAGE